MRTILFAYQLNAEDITVQSGRPYSILAQLRARANVVNVSPLNQSIAWFSQPLRWLYGRHGRFYSFDRDRL
jgi:hypothetical protein